MLPKRRLFGKPEYVFKLNLTEAVISVSAVIDTYAYWLPLFISCSILIFFIATVSVPAATLFSLTDSVMVSFLLFLSYFML